MTRSLRRWFAKPIVTDSIPAGCARLTACHKALSGNPCSIRNYAVLHEIAQNSTILQENAACNLHATAMLTIGKKRLPKLPRRFLKSENVAFRIDDGLGEAFTRCVALDL